MTSAPGSVVEVAERIVASDTPVLIFDTCALLDIVRLPARARSQRDSDMLLAAAGLILTEAKQNHVSLVLPPHVSDEWRDNLCNVEAEAREAVRTVELRYGVLCSVQSARGDPMLSFSMKEDDIIAFLKDLTGQLIASSARLAEDNETRIRALERVMSNRAPASKGTVKDCLIYEHMLQLMRHVRHAGHRKALVFLTSNTNDFCKSGAPKEPIEGELRDANACLCTTWNWAMNALKIDQQRST
jgi:hypothetical protein